MKEKDGKASTKKIIEIGVAQEAIISTNEFSIFMDKLLRTQLIGKLQLYADDAVLMEKAKNVNELAEKLQDDMIALPITG